MRLRKTVLRARNAPCLRLGKSAVYGKFTIFVAVAVIGLVIADWASAHGSGFQLTRQAQAGPYDLLLGTIPDPPIVGEAILILQVADPNTGVRVLDAVVSAASVGPEGPGAAITFGPDSYDPTLYEARAVLENAGPWQITITVSGPMGDKPCSVGTPGDDICSGSATFTYDVKRASPVAGLITLATLLAFVTILGLSMRAFLRQRPSRKQRANGQSRRRR